MRKLSKDIKDITTFKYYIQSTAYFSETFRYIQVSFGIGRVSEGDNIVGFLARFDFVSQGNVFLYPEMTFIKEFVPVIVAFRFRKTFEGPRHVSRVTAG